MRLLALSLTTLVAVNLLTPWTDACAQEPEADAQAAPVEAEPIPVPEEEATPPTPAKRLEIAVRTYQRSDADTAQALLAGLVNDETYEDEALRQEARVYLGEVLYLKQDQEAARRVFERVLTIDPTYRIDPFRHPPDVCGFFETIRAYVEPKKTVDVTTPGPVPPLPPLGYMGFGVYQLQHGRTAVGAIMLATQTVTGVLSIIEFGDLLGNRRYDPEESSELSILKRKQITQWTSTGLFYGIWGWSILDAGRHWRANIGVRPPTPNNEPSRPLPPPGIQLQVSGHFR